VGYITIARFADGLSSFTSCYDESSTQEEIFQNDVRPLIDVVYNGVVSNFDFVISTGSWPSAYRQ
jgi:hypothetical protein